VRVGLFVRQQPALDVDQVAAVRMSEAAEAAGGDHAMAGITSGK